MAEPAKYLPVLAKTSGYLSVTGMFSFNEKDNIKNGTPTMHTYKGDKREILGVVR